MRPAAEIGEVAPISMLSVERDVALGGVDELELVRVVREELPRLVARDLAALPAAAFLQLAPDLLLDPLEILLPDRLGEVEVVVEAVLDRRADRQLHARIEARDRLGEQMRRGVAQHGKRVGVAVWTGTGLVGDWLLLPVLRRTSGARVIRVTALLSLLAYPAFLLIPGPAPKLVLLAALGLLNSGWYAIPKAWLYDALPDRSGAAVAVGGLGGIVGAAVPLLLGFLAGAAGIAATMWVLLLAPVALLALTSGRS